MVLIGEAFYDSSESLNLSLEGGDAWFVSLNIVGGRHQASKHHATLCLGSDCMAYKSAVSHRWHQLMMPKIVNKSHSPHVLKITLAQHRKRRP